MAVYRRKRPLTVEQLERRRNRFVKRLRVVVEKLRWLEEESDLRKNHVVTPRTCAILTGALGVRLAIEEELRSMATVPATKRSKRPTRRTVGAR
jgi:hypothetical protein